MSTAALLGTVVIFWTLIGVAIYLIVRSSKKSIPMMPVQTPSPVLAPVGTPAPSPYFAPAPAPVGTPKVNCVQTAGTWSECSKTCGGGTKTRTNPVTVEAFGGGTACPFPITETTACNTTACPVNCVQTEGTWSECSKTCGGGTKTRTNPVTVEPSGGGTACPFPRTETRTCNTTDCPVDCVQDTSQTWGQCSKPCGGGKRTKLQPITVQPNIYGKACGPTTLEEDCNIQGCPVDCVEGDWAKVGDCSKTCGGGTQSWTHPMIQPQNGGKACPPATKTTDCNTQACPVDCVGAWKNGTTCSSTTCGVAGSYTDTYAITTAAANGGAACETTDGATRNSRSCTPPDTSCNQDCVGKWNAGTTCSTNKCGETGKFKDTYSVSVAKKGSGAACEAADGATQDGAACTAPSGTCDQDCVVAWSGAEQNAIISKPSQGRGAPCPVCTGSWTAGTTCTGLPSCTKPGTITGNVIDTYSMPTTSGVCPTKNGTTRTGAACSKTCVKSCPAGTTDNGTQCQYSISCAPRSPCGCTTGYTMSGTKCLKPYSYNVV